MSASGVKENEKPNVMGSVQDEKLLTLAQVGEILQISRTSVWKLIAEGGLRRLKYGKIVRVRQSDLEAWLEKHTTSGDNGEGGVS